MSDPAKPSDVPDLTKAAEAFVREATRVLAEHQGGAGQSAQEIANEWVRLAQAGLQRNLTLLTELVQARSPQTVTDVQSRILRENMDALVQDSARTRRVDDQGKPRGCRTPHLTAARHHV